MYLSSCVVLRPQNSLGPDKREESTEQYCAIGQEKSTQSQVRCPAESKQFGFKFFAIINIVLLVESLVGRPPDLSVTPEKIPLYMRFCIFLIMFL